MAIRVYRQGDCLFIPVLRSEVPQETRLIKSRLIRRGEHGGRHEIEPGAPSQQIESVPKDTTVPRRRFLQVLGGAVGAALAGVGIVHGEHNRLELPAQEPTLPGHEGDYEIRVQRELDAKNAPRFVGD